MQALILDAATARMVVADVPAPEAGPGQVLVAVRAAAVNEMDVESRAGGWREYVEAFRERGPVITGFEFAGVVVSDGARVRRGERVIGYVHVLQGPRTHAGIVAVDEANLAVMPDRLGFPEAAALVSMGLTAIEILEGLKPLGRGRSVLVLGAAGGVGVYSVQLAKRQGAHVTAFCAAANAEWIISQGADDVRSRDTEPFRPGDAFDLIVDAPAKWSFAAARPYLARDGMYVTTNPFADPQGFEAAKDGPQAAGHLLMLDTTPAKLARLLALAGDALRPAIDSIHDLELANAAFDRFATPGKRGRVLLQLG